ncbi:hypothetical protein F2P56_006301 [Juglans regia]|uniref:Reverse transcriptase Ty1/copia-type domain-containing protein n=2 Tax=Juglans regia TaxID=51240 RepID=A0A834CY64_JUGRE|nr:uncharacterized mitochondrial protein AtMg00810-like [Juglans regia]KAF5474399.1 hypothetical protein F2P56_006301 [Juglans regia]
MKSEIETFEANHTWSITTLPHGKEIVGSIHGWHLAQLDVHNAFLNGDLNEEIYMDLPPSYVVHGESSQKKNLVCRLHKSLYGLKQASTLLVYVDDIIVGSNNLVAIETVKTFLHNQFKIKDLSSLKLFLGIKVARTAASIHICQRKYTLEILEDASMLGCKPVNTPIETNHNLSHSSTDVLTYVTSYWRLIGRLIYLTISKPDITYDVSVLSQFMDKPAQIHLHYAHIIFRYFKGSIGQGIFSLASLHFKAYSDSDWAACPETRKSVIVFCIFLGDSLVS